VNLHFTPEPWMESAECLQYDPDTWFPSVADPRSADRARLICATCPTRLPCLNYALSFPHPGVDGVWAGTTPDERQRLRKGAA
jgi:hypothetical protein